MANIKIAQLTNKTTLADTDILLVEDTATKKMTVGNLKNLLLTDYAKKQQQNWMQLSLENGWTGTFEYRKNEIGQIEIKGRVTVGIVSNGTTIASIPSGYRPSILVPLNLLSNGNRYQYIGLYISTSGAVVVGPNRTYTAGDQIDLSSIFAV